MTMHGLKLSSFKSKDKLLSWCAFSIKIFIILLILEQKQSCFLLLAK